MTDVTNILGQMENGDPSAAEKLLPVVYEELSKLAAAERGEVRSDRTLQTTALLREACLRLVDVVKTQKWNSRSHFYGAAAKAMRRFLVESARRKSRVRHGGESSPEGTLFELCTKWVTACHTVISDVARTRAEKSGMSWQTAAEFLEFNFENSDEFWNVV